MRQIDQITIKILSNPIGQLTNKNVLLLVSFAVCPWNEKFLVCGMPQASHGIRSVTFPYNSLYSQAVPYTTYAASNLELGNVYKMACTARVVCWQNREEWLYVYRTLFNFENPDAQRRAADRVAAWKSRSVGKLPLAIESTANLISAHLGLVDLGTRDVEGRLTLAMAIVRFVNGMVDQVQKGKFARSVQSIGEEIGLPDWLVDLRHEATHASLPSLETLHCGLRASLSWLEDEYWKAQLNMHEDSMAKLQQLLNKYRDVALRHVLRRKKMTNFKSNSELTDISNEIANFISMSNLW